ncbi:MAG TPA: PfkB family carbohydrate kinase, partial [Beutenbergiaceae bacterium]|nr:PfkB family carbohydrate kinase [Beutenbergiaceae bacterium]
MTPVSPTLIDNLARRRPRVVVIGDLILDGWWVGQTERISREAPAPVVEVTQRTFAGGGAANTALNLAAMGAEVTIIGVVGTDAAGETLRKILDEGGVNTSHLVEAPGVCTTSKNRILSADHVLMRLDDINHGGYPQRVIEQVAHRASQQAAWAEAEVICDYGCGVITPSLVRHLSQRRHRPPLLIVDAHDLHRTAPLLPDVVIPNAQEFAALCGPLPSRQRAQTVVERETSLLRNSGAHAAIVTLDKEGSVLLTPDGTTYRTYAKPVAERYASGAGDTFTAAVVMARAAGQSWQTMGDLAQLAATIVTKRAGTAVCTTQDMRRELNEPQRVSSWEELRVAISDHREAGERIVFTNGCFDVVDPGHVSFLRQAKGHGDVLVAGISDDHASAGLTGAPELLNSLHDRAAVLNAVTYVDYVVSYGEHTLIPLLELIQPEVYATGGDYSAPMVEETLAVRSYGG